MEKNKKASFHLGTGMRIILILVSITLVSFIVGMLWGGRSGTAPKITEDLLNHQLQSISELASLEYHYTNMGKFQDQADFYGWQVPLTKKSFIISYDGVIKAGVDLSLLKATVKGKSIHITLPASKILSHEIDQKSIEVFDETKNIFNPISLQDYTQFSIDQQAKVEEKAIQNGLLTEANEKVQDTITTLLNLSKEIAENYTIVFS